jgi:ankyrin repeat protein
VCHVFFRQASYSDNDLIEMSRSGSPRSIKLLFQQFPGSMQRKVNAWVDSLGRTMLMVAASGGNVANCEALLDGKASLDQTDRYSGWTALMHARSDGRLGPLELLVKRGASLTIKNKHGKTAIDVARNAGHTAAWVLLRQAVSASRQGGDAPEMNHKVGINMSVVVVPPIFHAKSIAHNIVLALVYSADAFGPRAN